MAGVYLKRKFGNAKKWVLSRPYYIRKAYNKKIIKSRDFTVISNNCWAGKVYQYLDMPYLSPTVGLYFFADDYLKFVKNLKYYLSCELCFISPETSKYYSVLKQKNHLHVPIGVLDDVEIVFLHYKSQEEASEKWNRRKLRVNYEKLIFKFSNMNLCKEEHMKEFDSLPFERKIILNFEQTPKFKSEYYWNGPNDGSSVLNDTTSFPGNLNLKKLLRIE